MDCSSQEEKLKLEELFGFVETQKTQNFPEVGSDMKARDGNEHGRSKREATFK